MRPTALTLAAALILTLALSGCHKTGFDAREGILMAVRHNIVKSSDDGQTWQVVYTYSGNMYLHALYVNPANQSQVAAWGGLHLRFSDDRGNSWRIVDEGLYVDWLCFCRDWVNPGILYAAGQKSFGKGVVARSEDAGMTWALGSEIAADAVWRIAADPTQSRTVYASGMQQGFTGGRGIFKSTDAGQTWCRCNNGLAGGDTASVPYLVAEPGEPPVVWATVAEFTEVQGLPVFTDFVYKSTDHGGSWVKLDTGACFDRIDGLAPDYSTLYGWAEDILKRSTDGGETWEDLPGWQGSSTCLFLDKTDGALYVASDGVYRSTDGGQTFECLTATYEFKQYERPVAVAVVHE